jgi:hypothetical protein
MKGRSIATSSPCRAKSTPIKSLNLCFNVAEVKLVGAVVRSFRSPSAFLFVPWLAWTPRAAISLNDGTRKDVVKLEPQQMMLSPASA